MSVKQWKQQKNTKILEKKSYMWSVRVSGLRFEINQKNILRADVVEINISTKDAKIFMYEEKKKVKISSN